VKKPYIVKQPQPGENLSERGETELRSSIDYIESEVWSEIEWIWSTNEDISGFERRMKKVEAEKVWGFGSSRGLMVWDECGVCFYIDGSTEGFIHVFSIIFLLFCFLKNGFLLVLNAYGRYVSMINIIKK